MGSLIRSGPGLHARDSAKRGSRKLKARVEHRGAQSLDRIRVSNARDFIP
jgi:hypothetical protein